MAKTKLTIYLIKEDVDEGVILKPRVPYIKLENGNKLYYKDSIEKNPLWTKTFFPNLSKKDLNKFKSKSVAALIIYKVDVSENKQRKFAVCFGYGRNLLSSDVWERRFGLLVALNSIDTSKIRSVDTNTLGSIPIASRIQSSALSGISTFNIDRERDLLKSVTGRAEIEGVEFTMTGKDTLSVNTDKSYNNIYSLLRQFYDLYMDDGYKKNYDWVDHIKEIKDASIKQVLDNILVENINAENADNVWISIPEIIDWDNDYKYRLKSVEQYQDLDIKTLKSEFEKGFSLYLLKKEKVNLVLDQAVIKSWTIYNCLYTDISYNGKQYLLNDGKWYEIESQYVEEVKSFYENAELLNINLPDYNYNLEKEYNENVASGNKNQYVLMDRKLIPIGGDKIEFCDLYSKDKKLIHVKKYNGSAVLSHLFSQGLVSAESFMDKEFRTKVNSKFKDLLEPDKIDMFKVPEESSITPGDYEIVFAIAKKDVATGDKPDIPFFSKVTFRNVATRLKNYGYNVSLFGLKAVQA